jgi:hypothetical protein
MADFGGRNMPFLLQSPERMSLCDGLIEALRSDDYHVYGVSACTNPTISFIPRRHYRCQYVPNQHDLANPASFILFLQPDYLILKMQRATSIRIIMTLSYEDPLMFEKLASILGPLGICLKL